MSDRIDDQLATFYAHISQQPLTATLEDMTMNRFKERAARRVFATFATGTLVVAVAIAAAVVGLAAHLGRVAPGPAAAPRDERPGTGGAGEFAANAACAHHDGDLHRGSLRHHARDLDGMFAGFPSRFSSPRAAGDGPSSSQH
jgi:hypothetical protein